MTRPEKPPAPDCMTEGCDRKAQYNGICSSCYGQAKKLIDEEETTWEELEAMGMVKGKSKPFTLLFRKKKLAEKEAQLPETGPETPTIFQTRFEDLMDDEEDE